MVAVLILIAPGSADGPPFKNSRSCDFVSYSHFKATYKY